MIRKVILLLVIFSMIVPSAVYAISYTDIEIGQNGLTSADNGVKATADVSVDFKNISYFEIGFLSSEYSGSGNLPLSNSAIVMEVGDDGVATGSVYVYWGYATNDYFNINLSITDLGSEEGDEIGLEATVEDETVTSESPYKWEFNTNNNGRYTSEFNRGVIVDFKTTESVYGKKAVDYTGTLTLTITTDQGGKV